MRHKKLGSRGRWPLRTAAADIDPLFRNSALAVFGEATYALAPRLKLTAGLSQTWERKRHDARWQASGLRADF